jgi:hypothetical protein
MAPPTVSKGKLRKVLRRIERARAEAEAAPETARLSEWETDYLGSVETRLDTYGAAFRDPSLGRPGEPLSTLQKRKLDEIDAKLKGESKGPTSAAARPAFKGSAPKAPPPKGSGLMRRTPLRQRKPGGDSG